jgi:hypothetical protein
MILIFNTFICMMILVFLCFLKLFCFHSFNNELMVTKFVTFVILFSYYHFIFIDSIAINGFCFQKFSALNINF